MIIPPGSIPATTLPGLPPRNPAAPPTPSFTPQAVQFPGSPGQGPGFSLSDHIHAGVKEVIAGNNVTVTGDATSPVVNATAAGVNPNYRFLADISNTAWTSFTFFNSGLPHNIYDNPSGMLSPTTLRVTIPSSGVYLAGVFCTFGEVSNPDGKYNFALQITSSVPGGDNSVTWALQFYKSTDGSGSTSSCFGEGWSATRMLAPSATHAGSTFHYSLSCCADNPSAVGMVINFWMAQLYPF